MALSLFRDPLVVDMWEEPTFDHFMHRMAHDMDRMNRHLKRRIGDNWLNENERLDNPIVTDADGNRFFRVHFDLHQYKPSEIAVSTKDGILSVKADHEEKSEGRSLRYHYHREYTIPDGVKLDTLTSKLAPSGVLNIEAPLTKTEEKKEMVIPIEHHG